MNFKSAIVDPDDQLRLIEAAGEKLHVQQSIKIILKTGMHISVLCDPKKYNFRVENGVAIWRRPKTRKWMHVRITPFFNFIDKFMRKKRKYSRHSYFSWFKYYGNKAGLDNVSPSTLRHTCAWNLALVGKSVPEVAAFLGCSYDIAERHYLLITGEDVDRIEQWRDKVKTFYFKSNKMKYNNKVKEIKQPNNHANNNLIEKERKELTAGGQVTYQDLDRIRILKERKQPNNHTNNDLTDNQIERIFACQKNIKRKKIIAITVLKDFEDTYEALNLLCKREYIDLGKIIRKSISIEVKKLLDQHQDVAKELENIRDDPLHFLNSKEDIEIYRVKNKEILDVVLRDTDDKAKDTKEENNVFGGV